MRNMFTFSTTNSLESNTNSHIECDLNHKTYQIVFLPIQLTGILLLYIYIIIIFLDIKHYFLSF